MTKPKDPTRREGDALSIPEFCRRFDITDVTYYRMRRQGRGPREIRLVNSVIRISDEAIRDWLREREENDPAEAAE